MGGLTRSNDPEQLSSPKRFQRGLNDAFGQAGLSGQFPHADGDRSSPASAPPSVIVAGGSAAPQEEIDEERRGQMIVTDQVTHQDFGDITFNRENRCAQAAE